MGWGRLITGSSGSRAHRLKAACRGRGRAALLWVLIFLSAMSESGATSAPVVTNAVTTSPIAVSSAGASVTYLPAAAVPGSIWRPSQNVPWHYLIGRGDFDVNNPKDMGLVDPSGVPLKVPEPQVYDIDGFFNGYDPNCNIRDQYGACVTGRNDAVNQLHARGKRVICYIGGGSIGDFREDLYRFPASVIGNPVEGWSNGHWLDIRQIDVLRPLMFARMKMCEDKGYDSVEPDDVVGYSHNSGFPLTYQDQLKYNRFLAAMAHSLGLSIALKGDIGQAKDLVGDFDFTINEQCAEFRECNLLLPFTKAGKAVFEVEYNVPPDRFCPTANANNWNAMLMPLNLDGGRSPCR
jgi:hypothetical protein